MSYINNTFKMPPSNVSPAWKSFGNKYQLSGNSIVPKNTGRNTSWTPSTAALTGKPLNPAVNPSLLGGSVTGKNTPKVPGGESVSETYNRGLAVLASNPANLPQNQTTSVTGSEETMPVKGLLQTPAKDPNSFGGLVERISDKSETSKEQKRLQKRLEEEAMKNQQIGEEARRLSAMYGDEIQKLGKIGAGAVAGNLSTGTNVVGSGNAAIASQSVSQRMQALGEAQAAALEGTGQQLTGQQQVTNALGQTLGSANTQQQLGLSGLGSAAGFAQPSPAGYGQTTFNPLTGSFTSGQAGLDPAAVAGQLAQAVRSGQMTYEQAVSSLGYAGGAGQQFLNQALGQGFNIPQSTATIEGQSAVLGQLPGLQSAHTAADGIKNKITTYLAANPTLNPTELAVGNKLQQWIEGKQLTDPKYQTLFNYLNEYTSTLAPILGVGGDATNLKTEIAQSFINAAASGQSIAEVLENMQQLSAGKLQDIRSGATGGGVVSSPTSYGTGGSTGGFAETW